MDNLLVALAVSSCTLYIHDYGAPVGMRMILAHPERLHAVITQNGNVYQEGLGAKWTNIAQYWADPKAHPAVVDAFLSFDATEQRTQSARRTRNVITRIPGLTSSRTCQSRPARNPGGSLYDYRTNVASYPKWQAWLREHRPPTLVARAPTIVVHRRGRHAYQRDLPDAEIHCWTRATSPLTRRPTRSPASSFGSWRSTPADGRPVRTVPLRASTHPVEARCGYPGGNPPCSIANLLTELEWNGVTMTSSVAVWTARRRTSPITTYRQSLADQPNLPALTRRERLTGPRA